MTVVIMAPEPYEQDEDTEFTIFLGGSIDMGAAEDWQTRLIKDLSGIDGIVVLNPRRDDWDSSWVQDPTPGTQFHEQVSWEMEMQELADLNIYYFTPDSKSPITLLELGLYFPGSIVCCPPEFYRYGNVKMVCDKYNIDMVETHEELLDAISHRLETAGF